MKLIMCGVIHNVSSSVATWEKCILLLLILYSSSGFLLERSKPFDVEVKVLDPTD